jgi:hypothetical protein
VFVSVLYMSMSLDGYIAGLNDELDNPFGDDGQRLHDWFVAPDGVLPAGQAGRCCSAVAVGCSRCCRRVWSWTSFRTIDTPEALTFATASVAESSTARVNSATSR